MRLKVGEKFKSVFRGRKLNKIGLIRFQGKIKIAVGAVYRVDRG